MISETVKVFSEVAHNKTVLLKENLLGFFILSIMAGIYICRGIMLIFSIGAPLANNGTVGVKVLMGVSFCIGLTLVIFAGAELFTGNIMMPHLAANTFEANYNAAKFAAEQILNYYENSITSHVINGNQTNAAEDKCRFFNLFHKKRKLIKFELQLSH